MEKMTQKDYFNEIIALAEANDRPDLVAFAQDRIEKLAKKSASKKPTKTQVENEKLKEVVLTILGEQDGPTSVSAILMDARIEVGTSTPKMSAILTALKNEKKVVRTEEKGRAFFALA